MEVFLEKITGRTYESIFEIISEAMPLKESQESLEKFLKDFLSQSQEIS